MNKFSNKSLITKTDYTEMYSPGLHSSRFQVLVIKLF